jgi:hypothetical protein
MVTREKKRTSTTMKRATNLDDLDSKIEEDEPVNIMTKSVENAEELDQEEKEDQKD